MNHSLQWPILRILRILVGIPIVLTVSYLWGAAMKGWGLGNETVLTSATLVSVVGASYTFLVRVVERSYYMVFWAREKIKNQLEEAKREAAAKAAEQGMAKGAATMDRAWRAWYERMQVAEREGRAFDEPPPDFRNGEEDS